MKRSVDTEGLLSWMRDIASRGERCPTGPQINARFGKQANIWLCTLARHGKLTIEISAHNWRVVEIDGMRTAENPIGKGPYRRIDRNGDQWCRDGKWERVAA